MPKKRRSKPQTADGIKTVIIKALIGSLVGLVVFFLLTALAAFILWKTDADGVIFKYIMLLVGAVSGLVGGFTAVRPTRKNGIAVGALSALPCYLIEILVSVLVAKNGIGTIGWILMIIQLVLSAVGGIIAVNKRK